ncbi:Uncharacterised protein [Vibrio cholerae]|nr:Uncharacterised protein [Vibrio cholerae]
MMGRALLPASRSGSGRALPSLALRLHTHPC